MGTFWQCPAHLSSAHSWASIVRKYSIWVGWCLNFKEGKVYCCGPYNLQVGRGPAYIYPIHHPESPKVCVHWEQRYNVFTSRTVTSKGEIHRDQVWAKWRDSLNCFEWHDVMFSFVFFRALTQFVSGWQWTSCYVVFLTTDLHLGPHSRYLEINPFLQTYL